MLSGHPLMLDSHVLDVVVDDASSVEKVDPRE